MPLVSPDLARSARGMLLDRASPHEHTVSLARSRSRPGVPRATAAFAVLVGLVYARVREESWAWASGHGIRLPLHQFIMGLVRVLLAGPSGRSIDLTLLRRWYQAIN